MAAHPWRVEDRGLAIAVRLTPRGGRDAIEGIEELSDGRPVLTARVRAAPEKGAANQALEELVARALGVPKTHASVVAGGTSRVKTVRVAGDPRALLEAAEALASTPQETSRRPARGSGG
jgi:uncharacterized protein YggU (UPF0235/DUF167 family)